MSDHLTNAREELQRAADLQDGETQEQIRSIDEGLLEMTETEKTEGETPRADRLEEVVEKVSALENEVDEEPRTHLDRARESITDYLVERGAMEEGEEH
ncbi:DUF7553 family protein [Halegenticoccus soli]|uniref:DUF7553 family protein n=1 Tax=Halegenticoccus soli TaxID=1985678 RepID=UPI000C6D5625|nr:hypothetical protein [Halegenticoccus soli]